jgi:UTP--glucose-1-phosphate uridylyltransferase
MKTITKAVVPAAGLGQRLRPIANVTPKEMFPIGCRPAIEWVIAEAVASGCTDVAVVISPRKQIIKEYLTKCCPGLTNACRLTFLSQPKPLGLGHALWLAREFCEGHPFAVLLPDDLVDGPQLPLWQMTTVFENVGGVVYAITQEPADKAARYGRLKLRRVNGRVYRVEAILERTTPVRETLLSAGVGRYILPPEFFNYVAMLLDQPLKGELDDSLIFLQMLRAGEKVHGVHIEGQRYDISTLDGYIAACQLFGSEKFKCKSL